MPVIFRLNCDTPPQHINAASNHNLSALDSGSHLGLDWLTQCTLLLTLPPSERPNLLALIGTCLINEVRKVRKAEGASGSAVNTVGGGRME
jgi:hypothetical protein